MRAVDGCGGKAITLTRRKRRPEYAAWEIHPVMKLELQWVCIQSPAAAVRPPTDFPASQRSNRFVASRHGPIRFSQTEEAAKIAKIDFNVITQSFALAHIAL